MPIFAFVIALGILFGYVYPTWTTSIADIKTSIEASNLTLEAAQVYTDKQNALAAAREAIEVGNLERLETFLPDSVDNIGLILDLYALARRTGIVLSNIDVALEQEPSAATENAPAGTPDPVGFVDLSLSAVGTYTSLKAFLMGVEKSTRILDVQEISVKGSETGVYTYQMRIRIFWLR